jgi:CelD/BcsL family acetyltransferase involved in cellulose biosynthesis
MNLNWNIEIIDNREKLAQLEPFWNELLHRSVSDTPFLTFEWITSWLEIFGEDLELLIIVIKYNEQIKGIAPLCIRKDRRMTFIGYPQNDYAGFIVDDKCNEVLDEIVRYLISIKNKWRKIFLDQFAESNTQVEILVSVLAQHGCSSRVEKSDICPIMVLDDLEAARKMYYKKNMTGYINWYKKEGDFRYNIYTDEKIAIKRLADLFDLHIYRWKGTSTPSYFVDEKMRRFYRELIKTMHPKGWIQFSSLTLDTKFLVLMVSFEYMNRLYLYKTCYNPDYAKKSPGQVIFRYLFDYAVEKNIKELDFARGDEGNKDRFANKMRQNYKIIIYRQRWKKELAELFYKFRYSRTVDILYRNKAVQKVKYRLMAILRKRA